MAMPCSPRNATASPAIECAWRAHRFREPVQLIRLAYHEPHRQIMAKRLRWESDVVYNVEIVDYH